MAHLVVTGGAGYVGSHALRALEAAGHTVVVVDASRFQRDFGWQPQHSDLDRIIRNAWDWLGHWKGI